MYLQNFTDKLNFYQKHVITYLDCYLKNVHLRNVKLTLLQLSES
jgi:hypothetical protein